MAIDKNSKAYQSLIKSGYTDDQINQMSGAVASGQNAKDVVANTQKGATTTTTTTPKTTTTTTSATNTNTAKPEYQGTGGSTVQPKDTSWDKGDGQYAYNPTSGYYEKVGESGTKTQTSTTPTQTTTPTNDNVSKIADGWNNMSYEQQQAALQKNPSLQQVLDKYGIGSKSAPEQNVTNQGQATPKQDEWDYQDNSPERMKQMADNVNQIYMSNPGLFSNEDTFRNFFINGKGRTPEQEQFLMDFYKNREMYNKLDNYTSSQIGNMYVNGTVPDSYLTYLKNSDPNRYAEVMDAKDKAQDGIKNQAYLESLQSEAGIEDSSAMKYAKDNKFLIDKDNNGVDDKLYIAPTEEELTKQNRINEIDSRVMEIKNMQKNMLDDLVEQYPGVPKATLMGIVQDRTKDISREYDDLMVERTGLAGSVEYLQNERNMESEARQQTINNLQKAYGMYYSYSPEGMSELAQAQYAATNVTLDQADNGTDTQKQMALQGVLDGYYDKYGAIIQRSEAQVINDVMAYAKKNGVSLSQALEENFLKPLRSKPQFATLSSGGLSPTVSFEKVGDTGYVFTVNPDGTYSLESVNGIGTSTNGYSFTDYTPISSSQLESGLNNFMSEHPLNSTGGQCGSFVNDYLQSLGYDRLYTDPIDKKAAITNTDEPAIGAIAVMDSKKYPQYGHTAIVTAVNGDKVKLLEANWGDDKKVHERWVNKSEITHGYFNPSLSTPSGNTAGTNNGYDPLLKDFFQKDPTKLTKDQWAKLKNMGYDERTYLSMRDNYLKNLAKEPDASTVKILDTLGYLMTNYPGREALMASFGTKYLPGEYGSKMGDYISYVDYIKQNLTMDNLVKLKSNGATFGSLTEGERPRIEASATRLSNSMSKDKYLGELLDIYNTYAKNAGMGELTLNDINRMYGSSSSSSNSNSGTPTIKPMKGMENSNVQVNNGDIDYDALFASL